MRRTVASVRSVARGVMGWVSLVEVRPSREKAEAHGEHRALAVMNHSSMTNCLREHGNTKANEASGRFQIWQWGFQCGGVTPPHGSADAGFYGSVFSWPVTDSLSLVPGYTGFA